MREENRKERKKEEEEGNNGKRQTAQERPKLGDEERDCRGGKRMKGRGGRGRGGRRRRSSKGDVGSHGEKKTTVGARSRSKLPFHRKRTVITAQRAEKVVRSKPRLKEARTKDPVGKFTITFLEKNRPIGAICGRAVEK